MEYYGAWIISIIVIMFFLGGDKSPLWVLKSYRKFIKSIGLAKEEE
tara:strand:- start:1461 stop:1598 length:138 start_codon:yes stop_codon:yes gene_type:complete